MLQCWQWGLLKKYVCLGDCKGVSETPGICKNPTCKDFNHPLVKKR